MTRSLKDILERQKDNQHFNAWDEQGRQIVRDGELTEYGREREKEENPK